LDAEGTLGFQPGVEGKPRKHDKTGRTADGFGLDTTSVTNGGQSQDVTASLPDSLDDGAGGTTRSQDVFYNENVPCSYQVRIPAAKYKTTASVLLGVDGSNRVRARAQVIRGPVCEHNSTHCRSSDDVDVGATEFERY